MDENKIITHKNILEKAANRVGQMLIETLSIIYGEDPFPRWYCAKCGKLKSNPKNGTVCGSVKDVFSNDLFREAWKEVQDDEVLTDDRIDDLLELGYARLFEDYELYYEDVCDGTEYVLKKHEGTCIDSYSSEFIEMCYKFRTAKIEPPREIAPKNRRKVSKEYRSLLHQIRNKTKFRRKNKRGKRAKFP
uniref:Uncharacterized protein n=1 Tax=Marseillevirus LCMAC102 TaxID=2506603 RepID=A0A481YU25_9VIRU|nr:MAG: uncharacterized protein LCMAC102_00600 [Marseillevirus LCMAC102]